MNNPRLTGDKPCVVQRQTYGSEGNRLSNFETGIVTMKPDLKDGGDA